MQKKLWNKDFILLLQGNAVSDLGDLLYSVAIGYWVYEKTGSSALMGIMSSISMFVTMFLSPFTGRHTGLDGYAQRSGGAAGGLCGVTVLGVLQPGSQHADDRPHPP